jgi:hypothetical protein
MTNANMFLLPPTYAMFYIYINICYALQTENFMKSNRLFNTQSVSYTVFSQHTVEKKL